MLRQPQSNALRANHPLGVFECQRPPVHMRSDASAAADAAVVRAPAQCRDSLSAGIRVHTRCLCNFNLLSSFNKGVSVQGHQARVFCCATMRRGLQHKDAARGWKRRER